MRRDAGEDDDGLGVTDARCRSGGVRKSDVEDADSWLGEDARIGEVGVTMLKGKKSWFGN